MKPWLYIEARVWARRLARRKRLTTAERVGWTDFYTRYRQSAHWHRVRYRAIRRAHGRCRRCERKVRLHGFQVHHVTYDRLGREHQRDLQAICAACHMREHGVLRSYSP